MRAVLTSQWLAVAPLTARRVCCAMAIQGDDAAAVLKMLQLNPVFPQDYLRLRFELLGPKRAAFWVADCPALADREPKGLLSLLDDPESPGLNAMVQAVNPKARCRLAATRRVEERPDRLGRAALLVHLSAVVDEDEEDVVPGSQVDQ